MEKARDVRKRIAEPSPVSRQLVGRTEGIELICFKREQGQQTLAFGSRPFIQCGLPLRRPPATQLIYERWNGRLLLRVTSRTGLPFGQDRLAPIFLATLAVRQKSRTIRFRSASEMLEMFGMHKGGKEYRRLVAAFENLGATVFFGTDRLAGPAKMVQRSIQLLVRGADLVQPVARAAMSVAGARERCGFK